MYLSVSSTSGYKYCYECYMDSKMIDRLVNSLQIHVQYLSCDLGLNLSQIQKLLKHYPILSSLSDTS